MPTTAEKRKEQRNAWREQNPLRAWRKKHGLAMMDVAASVGVAFSSVQQHENGGYFPRDYIGAYAKLMKTSEVKLTDEWNAWLDRCPAL